MQDGTVTTATQPTPATEAAVQPQTMMITGGAGFWGLTWSAIYWRGHRVVTLDLAEFTYPERDQITEVIGDIRRPADLAKAMQGIDTVIHTAAALPLYSAEDIYSTDIDGIRNVLQVAHEQGIQRVVHVSSTAVYGIPDHHPLVEDDKLDGVGPYGEAKVKAEAICHEYRDKGLCVPIIRPKSFVGPERLGSLRSFMTGPRTARIFRCSAAATIATNCSMWLTFAMQFIPVPLVIAPWSTMSLTLAPRNLRR
ncbi:MAG: NAD-dependent epimerase/dehydratase family protein [Caldilineaceae bacterium]